MLTFYNTTLSNEKENLKRLQSCRKSLEEYEKEFADKKRLVKHPASSPDSFKGNKATTFYTLRDHDIQEKYQNILTTQFTQIFEEIDTKIESIQSSIQATQQLIIKHEEALEKEKNNKEGAY
ncbi:MULTISPECIES: YwqH-like family protein [Priestia]|jgi:Mg2+ and Co2+ transporter CorA|uniref:YwqH-like family protein n=1 Tax=Priestia TaxID=2800373 RepID=UPI0020420AB2|nr:MULTISPECIES: DUF5082 family protein [Priestia]MCM3773361.1 DUF5082 domain-containing protein [Priestia aryabhattai]MDY0942862.1 DUF5082 family protein [Priestia megaterium]